MPYLETLLETIGLPKEDVTKIISLPEAEREKFDMTPYADKVKTNYSTQFKNDAAFFDDMTVEKLPADVRKKIESSQYGRAATITRDKFLKGLGLTETDIADLTPEQKEKLELFIPAVTEKYSKTKAGDKELQQQLIDARKQLEKFGPDYESGIATKYQTEANGKIAGAIFNANLISELSTIEGLKIPAADLAKNASDLILGKYGFERIGDYSVELRQKDKPAMKVLKEGTSHELTLKEALTQIATERGWIEAKQDEGKGGKSGSGKYDVKPGADGKLNIVSPHVNDKISKRIAEES